MTNQPIVSVVIPVRNGEKYINDCINSVLEQDYKNIEIIVVDDGSTDNTPKLVQSYDRVAYYRQNQSGATAARNLGLRVATGEFVKFLDADDLLANGCISAQINDALLLGADTIVYGYAETFNEAGTTRQEKRLPEAAFKSPIADLILRNISISLPLHRLSVLRSIGGFDERLKSRQEWNLHIRIALQGHKFAFRDVLVFRQRDHNDAGRISNRKLQPDRELENIGYAHESIKTVKCHDVVDAWACYLWGIGRQFALRNDPLGANIFFDKAKTISPKGHKKYFKFRYRLLSAILGPIASERIYARLKRRAG